MLTAVTRTDCLPLKVMPDAFSASAETITTTPSGPSKLVIRKGSSEKRWCLRITDTPSLFLHGPWPLCGPRVGQGDGQRNR